MISGKAYYTVLNIIIFTNLLLMGFYNFLALSLTEEFRIAFKRRSGNLQLLSLK
jgi:hypothetical protein